MIRLDIFWRSNKDWYETVKNDDGSYSDQLKDNAPIEAKRSHENYLKQLSAAAKLQRRTGAHVI